MHRGSQRIWNPVRNLGFLTTLLILSVLFSTSVSAFGDCYNFGIYNVKVVEKKKTGTFDGDLKELNVKYDYDNNVFRINLTYNKVPNTKQTTRINVGFGYDCVSTSEIFIMKGFTKKFYRDMENASLADDPDFNGKLKLITSTKNSVTLDWFGPVYDQDKGLIEYCVGAEVTQPATFYQNGINCVTTGAFTHCTGPGYVSGTSTKDELKNWAKSKYDDLDIIECGVLKSALSGFGSTPTPSPSNTYNANLPTVIIENLSLTRVPDGVNLFFSKRSNFSADQQFGYVLGIQFQKMPNINPAILSNYSETQILFNSYSYFAIKYSEIRDWLKSQGINSGDRAIMLSVKAHPKFANSNWSSGIYILPDEYK